VLAIVELDGAWYSGSFAATIELIWLSNGMWLSADAAL
jgi:hypothetical protein